MDRTAVLATVTAHLAALPGVTRRTEFGNDAFFVGGSRFAGVTDKGIVMHLPPAELTEVLRLGIAKPFVSVGAMGKNGWVELRIEGVAPELIERLIGAAHGSASHSHRRTPQRRPSAARHTRSRTRSPSPTKPESE